MNMSQAATHQLHDLKDLPSMNEQQFKESFFKVDTVERTEKTKPRQIPKTILFRGEKQLFVGREV